MAELKEFDVIRVCRSDGRDTGPGYWPVAAVPAASAAKKTGKDAATTTRVKAQMIRLEEEDPRFVEWRIKLGILLKQELAPNPEEGNPWYVHFPRGYWLYEKSKHLWVSGYPIKAKLFKSPQEFGLHLLWLFTPSMEYRDCCCIHCNIPSVARLPSVLDGVAMTPASAAASKAPIVPHKVTPVPLPTIAGQPPQNQAANGQSLQAAHPSSAPAPSLAAAGAVMLTGPTTQAPPRPQAGAQGQLLPFQWTLQAPLLFRAGELVWYQNGNSWRLGVIAAPGSESFRIIPVGHRSALQKTATKSCKEMRPFHAFSVPAVMLQELQDKVFDQVAWDELFAFAGQDRVKRTNLILDASKMAASKIDASYSLWCPLAEDMHAETVPYYGCFFGAERIEIGDCLRVKPLPGDANVSSDSSVLGLRSIIARRGNPMAVLFRGSIYQIAKADEASANAVPPENLPMPLRDEALWRSQVSPGQPWRWVLVKEDVLLEEQSVRGRFYPTHRLMPVLNEAAFNAAVAEGNVDSQYPYLNNRMDGLGGCIGYKVNRQEMLGTSVPDDGEITLEPLIRELGRVNGPAPGRE
ncbi:Uncharacterized protein TCAP_01471 [Tolypocladium capitatum]|uniref:Cryptic loci regulator 2 C-terminal domain-containing protein n=1 Tax=Tolypocladium capitatum TaxID=45235 RepID=A0A2K3QM55_9HYPO|nr:Uncharacterized protein TCAP_01471 [Tolypocladium capitatum]